MSITCATRMSLWQCIDGLFNQRSLFHCCPGIMPSSGIGIKLLREGLTRNPLHRVYVDIPAVWY